MNARSFYTQRIRSLVERSTRRRRQGDLVQQRGVPTAAEDHVTARIERMLDVVLVLNATLVYLLLLYALVLLLRGLAAWR